MKQNFVCAIFRRRECDEDERRDTFTNAAICVNIVFRYFAQVVVVLYVYLHLRHAEVLNQRQIFEMKEEEKIMKNKNRGQRDKSTILHTDKCIYIE